MSVGVKASLFTGGDADSFGVGYFYVGISARKGRVPSCAPSIAAASNEQGVELYYNVEVTPCARSLPIDLGVLETSREQADTAIVVGLRGEKACDSVIITWHFRIGHDHSADPQRSSRWEFQAIWPRKVALAHLQIPNACR